MKIKKLIFPIFLVLLISISACSIESAKSPEIDSKPETNSKPEINFTFYRRGAENPVVVLEEYSDFFCPHCANVQPLLKSLLEEFPKTLAIEFHPYTFMGSEFVHEGNQCAGEQGKFWEFQDEAFLKQNDLRLGDKSTINDIASDLGINMEDFKTCLDSDKYLNELESIKKDASEKLGINSTPSFVIEGEKVELPEGKGYYEGLQQIINDFISKPLA
jgi:predicted DsbA family dithiol-disulfide isomerase